MASVSEELRKRVYGSSSPSQSQINSVQKKANTLTQAGQKVLDRYSERKQQKTTVTAPAKTSSQPFWKTWFLDTSTNDQVIDSTTGQVIQVNKPSALGGAVKGGVKSTAAGFTNLGSTLLDLVNQGVDTAETYSSDYASRQAERTAEMLRTGRTTDGKELTPAMRETLQQNVQKYQQQAEEGPTESFAERHPVLDAVQNTVQDTADTLAASSQQDIDQAKEGLGTAGNFLVDVGVAGTQLAGDIGLALLTGGSALVPMAARAFGSGAQEARLSGADLENQLAYGLGSAALSAATEKISNVAAPFRKVFGEGVADKLAGKLVNRFGENAAVQAMSKLSQTSVGRLAASALGEGSEEFVEDVFQPVLQRATYDQSASFDLGQALYDAAIGATLGGLGGAVEIAGRNTGSDAQATTAPVQSVEANTAGVDAPAAETPTQATVRPPVQTAAAQNVMVQEAQRLNTQAQTQTAPQTDPLLDILLGGKRVDQSQASNEEFATLADRGDIGVDAKGKLYQMDPAQHIDQRNQQNVRGRNVNAFQFDHPELQPYMKQVAESLIADADLSLQFPMTRSYERTLQGNRVNQTAQTSGSLRAAMNETGLSRNQIIDAAQRIINDQGQENVAAAKSVELILDNMLSQGYTTMYGESVAPNEAYVNAKENITGAAPAAESEALPIWDMPEAQTDGLGAADSGSLNTAYDNLQAQSSSFYPEGANAARPVDVPTQDFSGRNISKSASTVMGAQAIPDDVVPMIEQMVADGKLSYDVRDDDASISAADQTISSKGFDGALEEFRSAVNNGKVSKDIVTLGQELLNNAANAKDGNAVAELMTLYQNLSTNAGQALQAMSIFRKLSPNSQLYGIRKTVENLNGELKKVQKAAPDVKISPELVTKFMEQTDQAGRDAVMQEIYQNVADQVPSTWRDKWNAWRYLSMLANPRTHIRNIAGNIGFQPLRMAKNAVAAGIEAGLEKAGMDIERTKAFGVSPSLYRAAWNDYSNVQDVMGGNKYNDAKSQINDRRRIFENKALETARKGNSAALEFEDAIFKRITYADSLAGYLKANGVTAEQLENGTADASLLKKARDYAGKEALKATYQDRNAISNTVVKIANDLGPVGEAILPFKRTPANILARAFEYSPVGVAKSIYDGLAKIKSGDKSVGEVIDEAAAGLTGSGLLALGAYMFASGLVTGSQGDDKDDKWAELLGHQGYALELPDGTSVTLDWLAPESLPFFMGVELMSSAGENGLDAESIVDAIKATANPMLELSMLQSINDLIDSVQYAEDAPLSAMIPSTIISYFSQAIPTIGGQIERSGESERMQTYTDKNSSIPSDVQYAIGRASSRIPGWDFQQIPYIDAWGRVEESGDLILNAANNFLNPAYTSQVEVDAVEKELQAVRDATGDTSVFPSRADKSFTVNGKEKQLTADEYDRYARKLGTERYKLLREAIGSASYKAMTSAEKAEVISDIYEYANGIAKKSVSAYEPAKWILNAQEAGSSGVPVGTYIYYKNRLSDLKDRGMNGSEANAQLRNELLTDRNLTNRQKNMLDGFIISDGFYIPKDTNVDYSSQESFIITQMSDGAQKRWNGIKSRFGIDADTYQRAWKIYQTDGITADQKRAQLRNLVGSDAAALYKAFGQKLD